MCILFVYVNPNPEPNGYRLVVATNRDEYFRRPAKDAFMCEKTGIIGGRDMEPGREGGMWLGCAKAKENNGDKKIKIAVLLNITGEKFENANGRGSLVNNYLDMNISAEEYIKNLKSENKVYNGFNLVAIELGILYDRGDSIQELQRSEHNNRSEHKHFYDADISLGADIYSHCNTPCITSHFTGKHILGFGNSPVNVPFTKVTKGRALFQNILDKKQTKEQLVADLINLLKHDERYLPDDELESRAPIACKHLSSIFVGIGDEYGTRAHSIILVNYNWEAEFIEHAMIQPINPSDPKWKKTCIQSNL